MEVFCNHCGLCCKIIPVSSDGTYILRDGFQIIDENMQNYLIKITENEAVKTNENYVKEIKEVFADASFYRCRYIDNSEYCNAEEKPSFCSDYPATPVAFVPDECRYRGEVFIKNEELKHRIRLIKEDIIDYETLIASGNKDSKSYTKIIENLNRFIKKYADFGANDW